jgi:acyl-[acyl-carrier-protein]-phospholipid O-acyltransferase/long-chain-fatty-acid--[acyl-carrier-protein] ligase
MITQNNLIKDKRFWPIFWTQFLGAFNDNLYKNALVLLITFKSFQLGSLGPEQMVALCGGVFILPFFLFSAFAGQVADKLPKAKLVLNIKLCEILIMSLGAIGFYQSNIKLLLAALFFMGLQSAFFGPVKYSILPELIDEEELIEGNALFSMGTMVSILLGTILGGVLISLPEIGIMMIMVTIIFLAIMGAWFSSKIKFKEINQSDLEIEKGVITATWKIIKMAYADKQVWLAIIGISWFWFLGGTLLAIFPVYVKKVIGGDESLVTLFLTMFTVGVAVGSMVFSLVSKGKINFRLVLYGSLGMSVFLIDLYFVGSPAVYNNITVINFREFMNFEISWRILFDLFMFSIFSGLYMLPLLTYIQQKTAIRERSRVIAANNILNAFFMVVSSLTLIALYSFGVTTSNLYLIFGTCSLIITFIIYLMRGSFFNE